MKKVFIPLLMAFFTLPVQANDTVTFKATFVKPVCTVDISPEIQLGDIDPGGKQNIHTPVDLKINCPAPVKTEVYAQSMTPVLPDPNYPRILMTGGDDKVYFWFDYNGTQVYPDAGTNPARPGFCEGTDSRICVLQPKTQVLPDALTGERTATIQFNVRYKA